MFSMNSCVLGVFGPMLMVSTSNNFSKTLVLEMRLITRIGSSYSTLKLERYVRTILYRRNKRAEKFVRFVGVSLIGCSSHRNLSIMRLSSK